MLKHEGTVNKKSGILSEFLCPPNQKWSEFHSRISNHYSDLSLVPGITHSKL